MKKILKNQGVQSFLSSLLCIVVGLLIGFVVLLIIEPSGAGEAITSIIKNFLGYSRANMQLKYTSSYFVFQSIRFQMCFCHRFQ